MQIVCSNAAGMLRSPNERRQCRSSSNGKMGWTSSKKIFSKTLAMLSEMRFESSFLDFHVCGCWGFESAPFSVLEILLRVSRELGLTQTPVSTVSISCASFGEIVLSRRLASGFKSPM